MKSTFPGLKKDDEFLKVLFRNSELITLIKEVLIDTGMFGNKPDWKENWSKVHYKNFPRIGPGARVEIHWIEVDGYKLEPDIGYIFTLPGWDSKDIWMSGIVHIPIPNGCEKCECDPEWHLLSKLTANELVEKIIIKD